MIETGVYFGETHSYYDLNLILAPFVVTPAKPKTNFLDIQGGDGSLDMTEVHGEVKFYDREFLFTFTVEPSEEMTFDEKVSQISNALNGKRLKITLEREPDYYWDGRCTINEHRQDKRINQIVVAATVKPYKYKQEETVITIPLSEELQKINLENKRKTVIPIIKCSADDTVVRYGDDIYTLSAGTHKVLGIVLTEGDNIVRVSGSGTITFRYQEGAL